MEILRHKILTHVGTYVEIILENILIKKLNIIYENYNTYLRESRLLI